MRIPMNKNNLLALTIMTVALLFSFPTMGADKDTVWIDVRSEREYKAEHLDGTEFIPHTVIGEEIGKLKLAKATPIKVFCRSGGRSGIARETLLGMGYTNVENVGGIADAKKLMEAK